MGRKPKGFFPRQDHLLTRNSAIADKPRDAFRGQSRSPNTLPFHMMGMVSYSCPIVTLSAGDILLQKCRDLKNRVKDP